MKITLLSGKTFDINADLGFDMKVVHSGRSRRLTLRIDKKDRMAVLTIPKYCSRKKPGAEVFQKPRCHQPFRPGIYD